MPKAYIFFLSLAFSVAIMPGFSQAQQGKVWTDQDFQELGKPSTEPLRSARRFPPKTGKSTKAT